MSRARDALRVETEREIAARRNSPAHRGLRRRLERRTAPDAVVADAVVADAVVADSAAAVAAVAPEPATIEAPEVTEAPEDTDAQPDPSPSISPARASLIAAATATETVETAEVPVQELPESTEPVAVSPYPKPEPPAPTDPTPTESFAIALGAPGPKKRRRWLVWLGVLVVIGLGYVVAAVLLRDAVPAGTTIEGVPAGDTVAEATKTARELAAVAAAAPVVLTAGENSTTLDAATAGLSVDVDATVASAGGFTLDPTALWTRLRGEGTDHEVVVAVQEPEFTDAVDAAADDLDSNKADASVAIAGTAATVTPGSQAVTVDRIAARDDILAVWPSKQPIELTAEVEDPDITTNEADALAAGLNAHVFAGPTTLTGPNVNTLLPAALVAANSTIGAQDGVLTWTVNSDAISQFILETYPNVENEPSDASYAFNKKHELKVTKGVPGRELDTASVGDAVVAAGKTTSRSAPIPYIETQPDVTAEELPTQDFTSRVSHFRTPLTPEPIRTLNLKRAAQLVTGTIVKPGERFNLTDTIGPITAKNGYYDAHVIVNGVLTTGIGGGLSQMATTSFNAGYFAGYDDIEHRPHSVWFPRYPAGRESTVVNGSINVVFENTTPYAMIMNSYVESGYLNVDIWSTPYYTVKTKASDKSNFTQPHVVESSAKDCEAKPNGQPGFKITNTRWVYHEEELIEKRSWTWTYRPDNGIKCVS